MWNETKEYRMWCNIKQRCYNTNHPQYDDYGGRGITMYEEWIDNPNLFISYILLLGECPVGYSLDKRHNDYGYHPMNLRWASPSQQKENQRKPRRPHTINIPVGETGYKWVTRTRDKFRGQFRHKSVLHKTRTVDTPEQAHEEVLQLRRQMGLRC